VDCKDTDMVVSTMTWPTNRVTRCSDVVYGVECAS
jgi:hypothetical protein